MLLLAGWQAKLLSETLLLLTEQPGTINLCSMADNTSQPDESWYPIAQAFDSVHSGLLTCGPVEEPGLAA